MSRVSRSFGRITPALFCLAILIAGPAARSETRFAVPQGLTLAHWEHMNDGLDLARFTHDGSNPQNINVARLQPAAGLELRTVIAQQAIAGGKRLEKTSSMCARVHCLAGVNGDFFSGGQPVGGLAALGQALRSPDPTHFQLGITPDGAAFAGTFTWDAKATTSDGTSTTLSGVNVSLRPGTVMLYTAAYGKRTYNGKGATEIRGVIARPSGPLLLGRDTVIRLTDIRHVGGAPIPANGVVLAGQGPGARGLDALWSQMKHGKLNKAVVVRVDSPLALRESVGGNPVLLRDGVRTFVDNGTNRVHKRHPRTIVGWNPTGEIFLVTVDGREGGVANGLTLYEATSLMKQMGATDAINLDGGGSTTFVTHAGRVINRPSDGFERGVATALVVVRVPLSNGRSRAAADAAIRANPMLNVLKAQTADHVRLPISIPIEPSTLPAGPVATATGLAATTAGALGVAVRRRRRAHAAAR